MIPNIQAISFNDINQPHIRTIRNSVFIDEQGISPTLEFDGLDGSALHVLVSIDDVFVATGRLLNDGHIGRVAVLKEYRGLSLGTKVVNALINEAKQQDYQRVYLGSQVHACEFYQKLGFVSYGETFLEAGIEHIHMQKVLY